MRSDTAAGTTTRITRGEEDVSLTVLGSVDRGGVVWVERLIAEDGSEWAGELTEAEYADVELRLLDDANP